jgi:hypothetical protein
MLASTLVPQVREHNRPRDRRTVPRDEHPRPRSRDVAPTADGLDVGDVKAHTAGGFQRFGDLVMDLLRVDNPHAPADHNRAAE